MIHGYKTLRRQLRQFVDSVGVAWSDVHYSPEVDENGQYILDDERCEISFRTPKGVYVEMAIFAPSNDRDHKPDGKNVLPLGKVAARCGGRKLSGPIDQETWCSIRTMINE